MVVMRLRGLAVGLIAPPRLVRVFYLYTALCMPQSGPTPSFWGIFTVITGLPMDRPISALTGSRVLLAIAVLIIAACMPVNSLTVMLILIIGLDALVGVALARDLAPYLRDARSKRREKLGLYW